MRRGLTAFLALGALACAAAGCGGSSEDGAAGTTADGGKRFDVGIGISAALAGEYAAYDDPMLRGMKFAAEEINESDPDVSVTIESRDNKGDQSLASSTAQELLDGGTKLFVLTTGDASVAQGQLLSAGGAVVTLGGATAPTRIQEIGERAFLVAFGDNVQASAMAAHACEKGYRTAYTLGSAEHPFTGPTPGYFAEAFAELCDGEVVGRDVFKIGQTDFGPQVTKIVNLPAEPDAIFTPMFVPDSGVFLKALRGNGVRSAYLGLDGNDSPLYAKAGGTAVDGSVYTTHAFAADGNAMARFVDAFEQRTGAAPESVFEALGRDHVYAYVQAVKDAGSTDPDKVIEAMKGLTDVELVTGALTMDPETRVPRKAVTLVEMDGTTPAFLSTVTPEFIAAP